MAADHTRLVADNGHASGSFGRRARGIGVWLRGPADPLGESGEDAAPGVDA